MPGSIFSRESQGTNKLIVDGARIYVDPAQLLDGHPKPSQFSPAISRVRAPKPKKKRQETSTPKCNSPLESQNEALGGSKTSLEQLAQEIPIAKRVFLEAVSLMQLDGKIELLPGGFVCLAR